MRNYHRWIMTVFAVILLYWTATGLTLQIFDMQDKTNNWSGDAGEYFQAMMRARSAPIAAADLPQMLDTAYQAAKQLAPAAPITAIDLRVENNAPTAIINLGGAANQQLSINTQTGERKLSAIGPGGMGGGQQNAHGTIKVLHRGNVIGLPGIVLALITAVVLVGLVITGTVMYFQLLGARKQAGRNGFFWRTGNEGKWRTVHRWVSIVAAVFVLNTAITGGLLAIDEIQVRFDPNFPGDRIFFGAFSNATAAGPGGFGMGVGGPPGSMAMNAGMGGAAGDANDNSALPEGDLPRLLQTTLQAARSLDAESPFTQVRLRMSDGAPQGIVVFSKSEQFAFNATNGAATPSPASQSLNYHQLIKSLHRGDIVGFNGRWIALMTGCSLLFLCISSLYMYFDLRSRRRSLGRSGFFWR